MKLHFMRLSPSFCHLLCLLGANIKFLKHGSSKTPSRPVVYIDVPIMRTWLMQTTSHFMLSLLQLRISKLLQELRNDLEMLSDISLSPITLKAVVYKRNMIHHKITDSTAVLI